MSDASLSGARPHGGPDRARTVAAATTQLCVGVPAVVLLALSVAITGPEQDASRALFAAFLLVPGLGLLAVWLAARRHRAWLTGLLGVAVGLGVWSGWLTWHRLTSVDPALEGVWMPVWLPALDAVGWLVIALTSGLELRWWRRPSSRARAGWPHAVAVLAPVAVVVLATVLVVQGLPGWMARANGDVAPGAGGGPGSASRLDGSVRWESVRPEPEETESLEPTPSGMAVPVGADTSRSAGVTMLDPASGEVRWDYQLRGVEEPPELRVGDGGGSVLVSWGGSDVPADTGDLTLRLSAETGELLALWPARVVATDPPVRFVKVAQGTNTVMALTPSGAVRWRYRPDGCDPRGVTSTPEVVMVVRRTCDRDAEGRRGLELVGLDAATGEPRWSELLPERSGESPPEQVVVRPGFQLEDAGELQRRELATGQITWSVPAPVTEPGDGCSGGPSVGTRVVALLDCPAGSSGPAMLRLHDVTTGELRTEQEHPGQVSDLLVLDDDRVLVLTTSGDRCVVEELAGDGWRRVLQRPRDGRGPSAPEERVQCERSDLVQVGGAVVVRFVVPADGAGSSIQLVGLG